ncbi:hypothetical protein V1512DRAFT_271501 [Lipomyces arxii]|uniref:uncharacterized protein n=1 Tax=Lipomyces arxii TaxID=56418 RepID=UPI0034CFDE9A
MTVLKLHVVVVGAGLGGLAASIALAKKGHRVDLVESAAILGEIDADKTLRIQIPPNSTAVLKILGVYDRLKDSVVWPSGINMHRYDTGAVLGPAILNPYVEQQYGSPYWLVHRADYHRALHEVAVECGVNIHINKRIISVDQNIPSVTSHDGTVFFGDVIIAADGLKSVIREAIFPNIGTVILESNTSAFRTIIFAESMRQDPELSSLLDYPAATSWIGPGGHIMGYPIRNGTIYNLVLLHPAGNETAGVYNASATIDEILACYIGWDPKVIKLIKLTQPATKWKVCYLKELESWQSKSGKIVLLGDACHATVPFLAQGAAMAMEDAVTIAECFDRLSALEDIPHLLKIYETVRKPRTTRVVYGSQKMGDVNHLADGPEQVKRDFAMKALTTSKVAMQYRQQPVINQEIPPYELENPNPWSDKVFEPWLFGYDPVSVINRSFKNVNKV